MQLKRDTEYALRILYAVAGKSDPEEGAFRSGATLSEISALSGVPRVGIDRICGQLEAAGLIISRKNGGGDVSYTASPELLRKSLLDVVRVMEQGVPLFAVFDRASDFFSQNEARLLRLQAKTESLLDGETLGEYFSGG